MKNFQPTYLYIKQHTITGKLYFGKTYDKRGPVEYPGSGTHWKNHCKKHGKEYVATLWYYLFESKDEIMEFALKFSEEMDIVKSDQWLNLKPENGIDGGATGRIKSKEEIDGLIYRNKNRLWTEESRNKIASKLTGTVHDQDMRDKISKIHSGKIVTDETKLRMSMHQKGKNKPKLECPYCQKIGGNSNMTRYHFDNCKLKLIENSF